MNSLPVKVFLRSFAIQGSWNYRTMLGSGFGFALLPLLERLFGEDPERLRKALERHVDHFNAHPYLSAVALGAVTRMECDGAPPEQIRRFKTAVRGPLGGLGDTLVWAAWLPTVMLAALVLAVLGLSPWVALVFFLAVYNAGHLFLRIWGFRVGLRDGAAVAGQLRGAALAEWARRIQVIGLLLLGVLMGLLVEGGLGTGATPFPWVAAGVLLFLIGMLRGREAWRAAGAGFALLLAGIIVAGMVL